MPTRRPTAAELALAVRRVLEQADPPSTYERRVAATVLGILERELARSADFYRCEQQRLQAFLHRDGPSAELRELLCEQIARGELDAQGAALIAMLRAITLDKLAIDNPRYPAYRRAVSDTAEPQREPTK
jgi:hypothetical protein